MDQKPENKLNTSAISDTELLRVGARFAKGATPEARASDALERYIGVPNRMLILYSSEDEAIDAYILKHWAALDRLSGDICDIYPSLLQLEGGEDAYSTLADLTHIPGANTIKVRDLPVVLLWSDDAYAKIPIGSFSADPVGLRTLFRHVVSALHDLNRGIADGDGHILTQAVREAQNEVRPHDSPMLIYVDWRTDMSTHNTAGPGSVIVSGGSTGDISLQQTWTESNVDLSALAAEFERLRRNLRAEGDTADHDLAVGQIAAAESAAKEGDQAGVLAALKSTGKWVLGVAEKIGVGLAVQAIKSATGL